MKRALSWLLFAVLVGAALWFAPRPVVGPAAEAHAKTHVHVPATRAEDSANLPPPLVGLDREHEVVLVYFVPSDREPRAGYAERIRVAASFAAEFIRRDLVAKEYLTEGLDFAFDGDLPRVELIRGSRPAIEYRGASEPSGTHAHGGTDDHFWNVVNEVARKLGPTDGRVYLVFTETADEDQPCFDAFGNIARGTLLSRDSGAVVISAWAVSERFCAQSAEEQLMLFDDLELIDGCVRSDGTRVRLPRFEFVEEALGSIAHELGHGLGMLHDFRTPAEDLMGLGTRSFRPGYRGVTDTSPRVWISPQNALLLRRSPFLFDDVDGSDTVEPALQGRLASDLRAGAQEVAIDLVVDDDGELAALVFYSVHRDTVLAGYEVHGRHFEFHAAIPHPTLEHGPLKVVAFALDRGGNRGAIVMRADVE